MAAIVLAVKLPVDIDDVAVIALQSILFVQKMMPVFDSFYSR